MKASASSWLKPYLELVKPERTLANVLTAAAGFLFASQWKGEWSAFTALILGSTLIIASACVLNNFFDRELDRKMSRTKNRVLATQRVGGTTSIIFGLLLGVFGFFIASYTNWLTVAVLAGGYFSYVVLYGIAKRFTVYSTLIGTAPGAASMVAGYTAVTSKLDEAALILFAIMLSWQMVHFYAIGIYRLKDYTAVNIPIWPVNKGIRSTKMQMLAFLIIFIFSASFMAWSGHAGYIYLAGVLLLSSVWLQILIAGLKAKNNEAWARGVFKFSLVVLIGMSALLALGHILP